jgi:hypothetical protein
LDSTCCFLADNSIIFSVGFLFLSLSLMVVVGSRSSGNFLEKTVIIHYDGFLLNQTILC